MRAEARPEGVEAPAGLGCAWVGGGSGVWTEARPEGVAGRWCGLKPFLRTWKPLPGWGVWVGGGSGVWTEARPEGVEAPAGLGCVGGGGVRADGD